MKSPVEKAALILAGGAGTRLWPLSTSENPKQFLKLFGGESLIQRTFRRLSAAIASDRIFVSTNDRYAAKVSEQLPEVPPANIIVEPARRNTAPAIAICAETIRRAIGDAVIGVFPSDHAVTNEQEFGRIIDVAYQFAAANDYVVTIGLTPTEPNIDFGYLELGPPLEGEVLRLQRFVEKPSRERAERFLEGGNFAWNGGMFIVRLSYLDDLFRRTAPEIARLAVRFAELGDRHSRIEVYESMPSISFDFAVMERAPNVATVRGDFGWSDVGSWNAIAKIITEPSPHLHALRAERVFAHSDQGGPIVVVGVSDIAVIASADGVLVLNLNAAEGLSKLIDQLE